jgi:hypothetical protein
LLIPFARTSLAGEVEQVPDRLEGADVARILPGIGGNVGELIRGVLDDPAAWQVESS